jgi:hypothetical protein
VSFSTPFRIKLPFFFLSVMLTHTSIEKKLPSPDPEGVFVHRKTAPLRAAGSLN